MTFRLDKKHTRMLKMSHEVKRVFVFLENFLTIKLITQNDSFSIQVGLDGDSRVSI